MFGETNGVNGEFATNSGINKIYTANGWTEDLCERCYMTDKDERGYANTTFSTSITMMDKLGCQNKELRIASLAKIMEELFPHKGMPKFAYTTSDLVAVYLSCVSLLSDDMLPVVNKYLLEKSGKDAREFQRLMVEIHTEFSRADFKQMKSIDRIRDLLN